MKLLRDHIKNVVNKIKNLAVSCRSRLIAPQNTKNIEVKPEADVQNPDVDFWKGTVLYETGGNCSGKKICLFAHFDVDAIVREYVVYYLQALKAEGFDVIFISTSETVKKEELDKIEDLTCKCIVRRNIGYDFGSWKTGFQYINDYRDCELVVLANDSVVGPVNSINQMFERMSGAEYDIWGVTDNYEINYHVQSYFICFTGGALKDGFLEESIIHI